LGASGRETLQSDVIASGRFRTSVLLGGVAKLAALLSAADDTKDAAIKLLELEEKAFKWYQDPARAFARARAAALAQLETPLSAQLLVGELESWQRIMYSVRALPLAGWPLTRARADAQHPGGAARRARRGLGARAPRERRLAGQH
jgi:hypothetical protein